MNEAVNSAVNEQAFTPALIPNQPTTALHKDNVDAGEFEDSFDKDSFENNDQKRYKYVNALVDLVLSKMQAH